MNGDGAPILEVADLRVHFPITRGVVFRKTVGVVRAVDGVSFALRKGETLGLVGESGCGKSTTARAIVRLVDPTAGDVRFEGASILGARGEELKRLRRHVQMVFQDPYASLNPRMTVGATLAEPLKVHGLLDGQALWARVDELCRLVGIDPGARRRYPHEFSGGQRQRIGLARALALDPDVVIADEPVSALDVSVQAQILNLLDDLRNRLRLTMLFIAHDLSVVRHVSDRVAVMYLGRIVELAGRDDLYREPLHPYTEALLSAVPVPDPAVERRRRRIPIPGEVPSPDREIVGCPFASRCPKVFGRCRVEDPALREHRPGHWAACHLYDEPATVRTGGAA